MQLSNILLLSTALAGASAASVHGNHHARHHAVDRRSDEFVKAVKAAISPPSAPAATPSASIKSASNVVADVGNAVESLVSDVYKAFCDGSVSRRATTDQIAYVGNTGTAGNYGCNMMEVPASLLSSYEYTMQITNVAAEPYQVICWNKIGRTGGINGFFKGMGESVTLTLAAGAKAVVAFEANTQGACGFAPGELPTSKEGCYQGTWAEFDFENSSNKGWSGGDCSSLTSEDTGGKVVGCRLCDAAKTCSTIYADGTGDNAYTKGTNDLDGVGINTVPGNVTYFLDIGYSK